MARPFFILSTAALAAAVLLSAARQAPGQHAGPSPAEVADTPEAPHPARRSTVRGRILDPSKAPVAGAVVTVTVVGSSPEASVGVSTASDRDGGFSLDASSQESVVAVRAAGFPEYSRIVDLRGAPVLSMEVVLQVEGRHDTVVVTGSGDYMVAASASGMRTETRLLDTPQAVTVVTHEFAGDLLISSVGDLVRYIPGVSAHQGENNRDQVIIRGNNSSADFFLNGLRDDVQYFRDLYNIERIEALKGPNAMTFGRGGGGGVINRVTKEAGFAPLREFVFQGGSRNNRRVTADLDQPVSPNLAFRLNGVYEDSDSFRRHVSLKRRGISPSVTIAPGSDTRVSLSYEHFRDRRVADRGIPSFQGRPAETDISTFFGNPDESGVRARVNLLLTTVEHQAGPFGLRNRTLFGDYDRGYQNFVPGAVSPDMTRVSISAYSNSTQRRNLFNQSDATYSMATGRVRHLLLAGTEFGRQWTDNFRNTGYFGGGSTSLLAPFAAPTIADSVVFRQSPTDADNHLRTIVAATYVQDQVQVSRRIQAIAGVRLDYFDLGLRNNRTGERLRRVDQLVSPRAGVVYKPVADVSVYGSYSVSQLPSAGDQFASLTSVTQQMKPEKFANFEIGVKWDVRQRLSLTGAAYRLDRTNTRATDPANPTRIVQTGSQRSSGYEFGWNGRLARAWDVAGGYALQNAVITNATAAAHFGARVAQVPRQSFSLWNHWRLHSRLGVGVGLLARSDLFAAFDNTVTLPGYARADAAVYFHLTERARLQVNVENLFDRRHYAYADGNNNISPGSPRAVRLALTTRF